METTLIATNPVKDNMNFVEFNHLLEESTMVIDKEQKKHQENGEYFNIFEITGIKTDEVKMCRMLAEIINPGGTHFLGSVFLKSFVHKVLQIPMEDNELEKTSVYTEYHTDLDRRIDIVISTPYRFIPIEVKIYASDQRAQCSDYYNFAKKLGRKFESKVYYLTLHGSLPRKEGAERLTPIMLNDEIVGYEEIVPISFEKDIYDWLDLCLRDNVLSNKPMILGNLKQFKNILKELCGNMDAELSNKLVDIISENPKTIEAACVIANNIDKAKNDMLCRVLQALENEINKQGLLKEQLNNKFDYKFNDYEAVKNFCGRKRTYPAICYLCKKIDESKEIWFLVEAGWNSLYCGFVIAENGDTPGKLNLSYDEIQKYIKVPRGFREETWWFYREYLLDNDKRRSPDFLYHNETLFQLFDEEYFSCFIKKSIEQIKNLLNDMSCEDVDL